MSPKQKLIMQLGQRFDKGRKGLEEQTERRLSIDEKERSEP